MALKPIKCAVVKKMHLSSSTAQRVRASLKTYIKRRACSINYSKCTIRLSDEKIQKVIRQSRESLYTYFLPNVVSTNTVSIYSLFGIALFRTALLVSLIRHPYWAALFHKRDLYIVHLNLFLQTLVSHIVGFSRNQNGRYAGN